MSFQTIRQTCACLYTSKGTYTKFSPLCLYHYSVKTHFIYSNIFVLLIYLIRVKFCLSVLLALKKGWPSDVFYLLLLSSSPS